MSVQKLKVCDRCKQVEDGVNLVHKSTLLLSEYKADVCGECHASFGEWWAENGAEFPEPRAPRKPRGETTTAPTTPPAETPPPKEGAQQATRSAKKAAASPPAGSS